MMDKGLQWLADQTEKHLSSKVLYRRGSQCVPLQACKARTTFELNDANGILISIESRDFLITANKLVLDELVKLPVIGDQVIETIGDELHSYEVNNFGGEWPYRYCDPYRHKLRIHTKYVGIITSL